MAIQDNKWQGLGIGTNPVQGITGLDPSVLQQLGAAANPYGTFSTYQAPTIGSNLGNGYSLTPLAENPISGLTAGGDTSKGLWAQFRELPLTSQVTAGVGALSGLLSGWNGLQSNKLAKDTLNFQKNTYREQWDAQRNMANAEMEDRQRRRQAKNANAMSPEEYMSKYGV